MDEGMTAIAGELETPAIEQQAPEEVEIEQELDASEAPEGEGAEGESQEPEIELIEIERNGKKFSIPKELESELLMQSDYTRKTQEVAATRKQIQAQQEQLAVQAQATEQELQARGALLGINAQIAALEGKDWTSAIAEDPVGGQQEYIRYQEMLKARSEIVGFLENSQKSRAEQAQQAVASRLQETRDFAEKNIKGWSEELDNKITAFAVSDLGFDVDTLRSAYTPQVYQTLYLAYLGQQTLAKQSAPTPPKVVKPLSTVNPKGGTVRKSVDQMSVDEMAAYLNKR